MHCVTKAMPIHSIDGKKLKSCRTGLTNHTWSISNHIMPLVMNAIRRNIHKHTHTHTHTDTRTKTISRNQKHASLSMLCTCTRTHILSHCTQHNMKYTQICITYSDIHKCDEYYLIKQSSISMTQKCHEGIMPLIH